MLTSILLTPVLGLTQFVVAPHEPAPPVTPPAQVARFVDHGTMTGSWASADLLGDGYLNGVMEDAQGLPLWVLDASLDLSGKLVGKLIPLEYASNPVLGFMDLAVYGQAQVARDGTGSFWAVIHSPYEDNLLPVYPLGQMEGTLFDGWPRKSGSSATTFGLADVSAVPNRGTVGGRDRTRIVCPKGPDHLVQKVPGRSLANGLPTRSGSSGSGTSSVLTSATVTGIQGVDPRTRGRHVIPLVGEGMAYANWVLDNL